MSLKLKFWNNLEELIHKISLEEKIFIGGDLNGHVGREVDNFKSVHGGYEFGATNEGKTILDFTLAYDFVIANTFFKKRDEHLITYKNGYSKTQIDYFLIRKIDRLEIKDCKVIPSKSLCTQHRLLVLDFKMKGKKITNKVKRCPKIRCGYLKNINIFFIIRY